MKVREKDLSSALSFPKLGQPQTSGQELLPSFPYGCKGSSHEPCASYRSHADAESEGFGSSFTAFSGVKHQAGWKAKQSEHKLGPTWDPGALIR